MKLRADLTPLCYGKCVTPKPTDFGAIPLKQHVVGAVGVVPYLPSNYLISTT